jgi:hypothetical protein
MTERTITSREHWLAEAINVTRDFISAERAENAYDLRCAAPDSLDYSMAIDSEACMKLAEITLNALEDEISEVRSRSELRRNR